MVIIGELLFSTYRKERERERKTRTSQNWRTLILTRKMRTRIRIRRRRRRSRRSTMNWKNSTRPNPSGPATPMTSAKRSTESSTSL